MNKSDMKSLVDNLESLDALGKLFSNLWYPKVKAEIQDEKLRAYLTVFEDAIPGIGNVLQYVKENADAIATGDIDTARDNFSDLADSLLNGQSDQERKSENQLDIEIDSDESSTDMNEEDNFTSNVEWPKDQPATDKNILEKKLSNENFVSNAPKEVIQKERKKLEDVKSKIKILEESIKKQNN